MKLVKSTHFRGEAVMIEVVEKWLKLFTIVILSVSISGNYVEK